MLEIELPNDIERDHYPHIDKKKLIRNLYFGFFITSLGESVLGPVYPEEAYKRGISEFLIGVIMGVHPLFSILSALWMGKKLGEESRKILMIIGSVMQGFGYLLLCLIYFIPSEEQVLFILLSGLGRILSGVGVTLYQNPCYSMVSLIFQDSYQMKLGYLEMLIGQGLILGFVQGSALYSVGGYTLPFMVSSLISIVLIPLTCKYVPSYDEIHDPVLRYEQLIKSGNANLADGVHKVHYSIFFRDSRIVLTFLAAMLPTTAILFLQPTFSLYLHSTLGISPDYSGYIFGLSEITYIIFCPITAKFQQLIGRRKVIGGGLLIFSIIYLFQGPAEFLHVKASIAQCIIIRLLSGVVQPASFVTALPEFMEIIKDIDDEYSEEQRGDIASALFNSAWHMGEVIGPILGGGITAQYGFVQASNFFAYVMGFVAIIYLLRYSLYEHFLRKKINKQLSRDNQNHKKYENHSNYSTQADEI